MDSGHLGLNFCYTRGSMLNRRLYEFSLRILAEEQFTASLLLNEFWVESSEQPLYREIGIGKNDPRFTKRSDHGPLSI